jgi:hypothetical protein
LLRVLLFEGRGCGDLAVSFENALIWHEIEAYAIDNA